MGLTRDFVRSLRRNTVPPTFHKRATQKADARKSDAPRPRIRTLDDLRPMLQQRQSPFGQLEQLGPVAQFSATPAAWTLPPAPLGSSPAVWLD